jgi:hypothetical protein
MKQNQIIEKALDTLEMLNFILSTQSSVSSYTDHSDISSDVTPINLPIAGMSHSLKDAISLLKSALNNSNLDTPKLTNNDNISSNITKNQNNTNSSSINNSEMSYYLDDSKFIEETSTSESKQKKEPVSNRIDLQKMDLQNKQEPKSSNLASRIRPVPEEVRGRVRELVDMIENDEFAR